ncbi:hypothetical protein [Microbispora siamensis]|uniref:Uncharacterized protein n=1 Tax=Microbispora siamensis TaxID=564413 RepID=A0ABQ4GWD2_9ACTN|nr:hypothetical protein [Microbispora siamensis]GIH65722.1 hypothetical protein Msi02_65390 [Microbispora siamensis]
MSGAETAGAQLYAHLAQLLAPADSLVGSSSMVILEPAGKDVGAMASLTGAEAREAMADLANAIPAAAPSFLDTGGFYDDIWNFVLTSALPTGPADDPVRATVARVIADNRADFELMALARLDLPADLYHPVSATPADWLGPAGWSSASFRVGGEDADPVPQAAPDLFVPEEIPELVWREIDPLEPQRSGLDPFEEPDLLKLPDRLEPRDTFGQRELVIPARRRSVLGDTRVLKLLEGIRARKPVAPPEGLMWRDVFTVSRAVETTGKESRTTSRFRLSFDYRVVGLRRPWLEPQLCHLSGWIIPGLPAHGLSTGLLTDNKGLMPVLTTRMLVVRDLVVEAEWSDADRDKAGSGATVAFGPFRVAGEGAFDGTRLTRADPQVVAWLAAVVPACPAP